MFPFVQETMKMKKLFACVLLGTAIAATGCGPKKETPKPAPPAIEPSQGGAAAPEGGAAPAAAPAAEPGK
jgi:hypothetical protein